MTSAQLDLPGFGSSPPLPGVHLVGDAPQPGAPVATALLGAARHADAAVLVGLRPDQKGLRVQGVSLVEGPSAEVGEVGDVLA